MKTYPMLIGLLWLAWPGSAVAAIENSHFVVVQGEQKEMTFDELLVGSSEFDLSTFRITEPPDRGQLDQVAAGLRYWVDDGQPRVYSTVSFGFEIDRFAGGVDGASVTLRLLPRRMPVIGDFFGDTELEIGLYRPTRSEVSICPQREQLIDSDCQTYMVPGGEPGLPMVGDWTGSGLDGLAIYHPDSGKIDIYGELPTGDGFLALEDSLDGPRGGWPVFGTSNTGFVFWRPQVLDFLVIPADGSSAQLVTTGAQSPVSETDQPLVRRQGTRFGFFDPDPGVVTWLPPRGPSPTVNQIPIPWAPVGWMHFWAEGVLGDSRWISFNPTKSQITVVLTVPYQGVPIIIDLPDDPD